MSELLPYHGMGSVNGKECGLAYKVEDGRISREELDVMKQILKEQGLHLVQC